MSVPWLSLSFAALALLSSPAAGQDTLTRSTSAERVAKIIKRIDKGIERFELFNACLPMLLIVEQLHDDAADINLTRETLQAAAESRLRAGRLYREFFGPIRTEKQYEESTNLAVLSVQVNVVGAAFNINVQYQKRVTDAFGETTSTTTWQTSVTGTHGGNAGFIVSGLSERLDKFLAAYLRVNKSACGRL